MKLARLQMVNRHAEERQALLRMIEVVGAVPRDEAWDGERKFRITVDGVRLDEAAHAIVRPVLLGELRARVRRIDADLRSLGIEVDT